LPILQFSRYPLRGGTGVCRAVFSTASGGKIVRMKCDAYVTVTVAVT